MRIIANKVFEFRTMQQLYPLLSVRTRGTSTVADLTLIDVNGPSGQKTKANAKDALQYIPIHSPHMSAHQSQGEKFSSSGCAK